MVCLSTFVALLLSCVKILPEAARINLAICLPHLLMTSLHHYCHFTGLDLYRKNTKQPLSIFSSSIKSTCSGHIYLLKHRKNNEQFVVLGVIEMLESKQNESFTHGSGNCVT